MRRHAAQSSRLAIGESQPHLAPLGAAGSFYVGSGWGCKRTFFGEASRRARTQNGPGWLPPSEAVPTREGSG
jgi:hypothetical protein